MLSRLIDEESEEEPSLVERVRGAVGIKPTQRETVIDQVCPSMTFQQRLMAFGTCFILGWVVSFSSMLSFTQLIQGNPVPFAIKCVACCSLPMTRPTATLSASSPVQVHCWQHHCTAKLRLPRGAAAAD